jgi:hypothetical protein
MLQRANQRWKASRKLADWQSKKLFLRRVICFVFICLISCGCSGPAQGQNQGVKLSLLPLKNPCQNQYRIALASVQAKIKEKAIEKDVNALGVVMVSALGKPEKMFFVYWLDPKQPKPTKRDDDSGILEGNLQSYKPGKIDDFLKNMQCSDPQMQEVLMQLVDSATRPLQAPDVAGQIKQTLKLSEEVVTSSQELDKDVYPDELSFATAVRNLTEKFALPALPTPALSSPTGGGDPPKLDDQGTKQLQQQIQALQSDLTQRSVIYWSIIIFIGFVCAGALYLQYRQGKKQKDTLEKEIETLQKEMRSDIPSIPEQLPAENIKLNELWNAVIKLKTEIQKVYKESKPEELGDPYCTAKKLYQELVETVKQFLTVHRYQVTLLEEGVSSGSAPPSALSPKDSQSNKPKENVFEMSPAVADYAVKLDKLLNDITLNPKPSSLFKQLEILQMRLEEIRRLSFAPDEQLTGDPIDELFKRTKESWALTNLLSDWLNIKGKSPATVRDEIKKLLDVVKQIDTESAQNRNTDEKLPQNIADRLKGKFDDLRKVKTNHEQLKERIEKIGKQIVEKIGKHISSFQQRDGNILSMIESIIPDYGESVGLLSLQPGESSVLLLPRLKVQQQDIKLVTEEITKTLKPATGSGTSPGNSLNIQSSSHPIPGIKNKVTELIGAFHNAQRKAGEAKQLENENKDLRSKVLAAEQSQSFLRVVSAYLYFRTEKVTSENQSSEKELLKLVRENVLNEPLQNRRIRLRFAAAISVFIKATDGSCPEDIIQALKINDIKEKMQQFLNRLEDMSGEDLWNKGLHQGFNDGWLHDLLRADLLLQTYLTDSGRRSSGKYEVAIDRLKDAVHQASQAVLSTLKEFEVEVDMIGLLDLPPENVDTDGHTFPELFKIPEAVSKVKQYLPPFKELGELFVVDIQMFQVTRYKTDKIAKGRVALVNPSAWTVR